MTREDRGTLAIALVLSSVALFVGLAALTSGGAKPLPSLSPYITRAEVGTGVRALNEEANAAIRARLAQFNAEPKSVTILRSTADGDRGTVVARVEYGPSGGPVTNRAELTIILHRTVWSVGQITLGAPDQDKN